MISALMLLAVGSAAMAPDQSSDVVLVSKFVEAVKRGADSEAQAMLTADVFIGDYSEKKRSSYPEFAEYARACQLRQLNSVPIDSRRMPIGVEWRCRGLEPSRHASFWFQGDKIARIGWGPPMVIKIPPVKGGR